MVTKLQMILPIIIFEHLAIDNFEKLKEVPCGALVLNGSP